MVRQKKVLKFKTQKHAEVLLAAVTINSSTNILIRTVKRLLQQSNVKKAKTSERRYNLDNVEQGSVKQPYKTRLDEKLIIRKDFNTTEEYNNHVKECLH